ncbi:MAG: type II secretion system F family protein, partial [Verrucomicrobiota bacterium]
MGSFAFKATAPGGGLENGVIEARSKAEAYQQILTRGLRPVLIEPQDAGPDRETAPSTSEPASFKGRISSNDLLLFTEEMAELLESGLQLEPALKVIESRKDSAVLRLVSATLRQRVRDGSSFSAALRDGGGFSDLFCSMIAAGETAGALPSILRRQTDYLTLVIDLRRKISAALIYPSIVFSAGIVLLLIFMMFLLPQLTMLLSKTGQKLPFMTRLLIAVSGFFGHYWWLVGLILAGLAVAFWAWRRTIEGRLIWDRITLSIPVIGGVMSCKFVAEFCQTLATLALNGVTLLNGLTLFQHANGNVYLKGLLARLVERVGEGATLSSALRSLPFFPGVLCDIVTVGEQSGDLAGALQRGAKRYDREFAAKIQKLTALIQPLTIL